MGIDEMGSDQDDYANIDIDDNQDPDEMNEGEEESSV